MISSSRSRILGNELLRDGFYLLRLEAPRIAEACVPGQFMLLKGLVADWPYLRRPFSIYSSDGDSIVEIVYKVVGRATSLMSRMTEGEYDVLGPLGNGFTLKANLTHTIALAGGAGLPPVAFYCKKYVGALEMVTLVIGARTNQELLVPVGLVAEGVDMRSYTEDGSKGTKGTVVDGLVKALGETSAERNRVQVIACGPKEMLARVNAVCQGTGISCDVSVEEMMACGLGACLSCAVPGMDGGYIHVCKDGPVLDATMIDWERWMS